MTTMTATSARSQLFSLIERTIRGHEPIEITSRSGNAILLSEEEYESLIETLELLSTPGLAKDIRKAKQEIKQGKTRSLNEVFGRKK